MRRSLAVALAIAILTTLAGCPMPQTPGARMQEAATELNMNSRFGRMELAIERVAPEARDGFVARRRAWGGAIRMADYELVGASMADDTNASLTVKYAWYREDEGDLHMTTIRQRWKDKKGDWLLVEEMRVAGDVGLFGEPMPPRTSAPQESVQYPTIRLGGH